VRVQIEKRIEHYLEVARELLAAAKRDRALIALKKKKMNEQQLQNLQAWLLNVEDIVSFLSAWVWHTLHSCSLALLSTQLNNMELRQQQNRVFAALKQGNEAFKTLQKEASVPDTTRAHGLLA
jgi:charged multivesicular body protein 6